MTDVYAQFRRNRLRTIGLPLLALAYLVYAAIAFDIAGVIRNMRAENAAVLLSDFWSYKTHVSRNNRSGALTIAIEGEAKATYAAGQSPDWVRQEGAQTVIDLGKGHEVRYFPQGASYTAPEFGVIEILERDGKPVLTPRENLPEGLSVSENRIALTTAQGRFSYSRAKTETFRYAMGWELFFFTLDSPFYGKSLGELLTMPRLDPAQSNLSAMAEAVWSNKMWRHGDVIWALGETLLMAFLGTMTAAMLAFPLAFFAAANFTPARWLRLGLRRVLDFIRGVDGLIWTVILSRAFGPGPMTGALAIFLTDTGTFGKTFSEALENIDDKQQEGISSTGADPLQKARFGVLPQVAPVILSQVLYYLESNTRSATVIGAIVGGGIGLLLTQAIITQKDWEEVSYYILLIVLMVMAMDSLSGWLRRKIIKGE